MKRVSLQKVQGEDLRFIQLRLHSAPVDGIHYSPSTMQCSLCRPQLAHVNEATCQAIGTL